jgi:hypothetical protein
MEEGLAAWVLSLSLANISPRPTSSVLNSVDPKIEYQGASLSRISRTPDRLVRIRGNPMRLVFQLAMIFWIDSISLSHSDEQPDDDEADDKKPEQHL